MYREDPECDDIDDALLVRLLEVSIQCALDNDKVTPATQYLVFVLSVTTNCLRLSCARCSFMF